MQSYSNIRSRACDSKAYWLPCSHTGVSIATVKAHKEAILENQLHTSRSIRVRCSKFQSCCHLQALL